MSDLSYTQSSFLKKIWAFPHITPVVLIKLHALAKITASAVYAEGERNKYVAKQVLINIMSTIDVN